MNKKGFTLVEIIISVALVLIIGTSVTFVVVKNISNKDLENVTKKILESANAYVRTEKDSNGNSFVTQINSGAKGVKIPVTTLVNSGYVDKSLQSELYDLTNDEQNYYVMFVNEEEYCDTGEITSIASWMDETVPVYLCNNYENGVSSIPIYAQEQDTFVNHLKNVEDVTKFSSTKELENDFLCYNYHHGYNDGTSFSTQVYFMAPLTHGLSNLGDEYFYRGIVSNNYVQFVEWGFDFSAFELVIYPLSELSNLFRILSFDDDKITFISEDYFGMFSPGQDDAVNWAVGTITSGFSNTYYPDISFINYYNNDGHLITNNEMYNAGVSNNCSLAADIGAEYSTLYYNSSSFLINDKIKTNELMNYDASRYLTNSQKISECNYGEECYYGYRIVFSIDTKDENGNVAFKWTGSGTEKDPYMLYVNADYEEKLKEALG